MSNALESYLHDLSFELGKCGIVESAIIEETRGHLIDALEAGQRRGLTVEAATREALERFGPPRLIAERFMLERHRTADRVLFVVAILLGMAIAYIDSRPTWDDTGVTVFSLILSGGVLGILGAQRPWLWSLAVGIWIPILHIAHAPTLGSIAGGCVILAFPTAGAYAGRFCRRAFAGGVRSGQPP